MPATKHSVKIQTLKPEMKAKLSTSLHKFRRQFSKSSQTVDTELKHYNIEFKEAH